MYLALTEFYKNKIARRVVLRRALMVLLRFRLIKIFSSYAAGAILFRTTLPKPCMYIVDHERQKYKEF